MPHSFVPVRFNPVKSAYWLSESAQWAATRLRTRWFWALRTSMSPEDTHPAPATLFVVASTPTPHPIPGCSLTLGPKYSVRSGIVRAHDAELLVRDRPLPCPEDLLDVPLYLHALPLLIINMFHCPPLPETPWFCLEEDSLQTFVATVLDRLGQANAWREEMLATHGLDAVKNTWAAPTRHLGSLGFGEGLNDPHSYVFDFEPDGPDEHPPIFEQPPAVYGEIMLYRQFCQDYRWRGAEATILWVAEMREFAFLHPLSMRTISRADQTILQSFGAELRSHAISLFTTPNPHCQPVPGQQLSDTESLQDTDSWPSPWGSEGSNTPKLPWAFEHLPVYFFFFPLSAKPKVVLFDIFGTILDREGAIRQALSPWVQLAGGRVDLRNLARRFTITEALVAREAATCKSCTSLATFVSAALIRLAHAYGIAIEDRSELFTNTLMTITYPKLYPDAEETISTMKSRGYILYHIPILSGSTTQHLRSLLPGWFRDCTSPIGAEQYASPHSGYNCSQMELIYEWCSSETEFPLDRRDVLVVSSSMGRILCCAQNRDMTTAHVKRPGTFEADVKFVVGSRDFETPRPCIEVEGLWELYEKLDII